MSFKCYLPTIHCIQFYYSELIWYRVFAINNAEFANERNVIKINEFPTCSEMSRYIQSSVILFNDCTWLLLPASARKESILHATSWNTRFV
jgi:hypothetical protein